MAFRCGFCGEAQPPGRKPVMVVTKIREKEGSRVEIINDTTANFIQPWEIVQEKKACPKCAKKHRGRKPEVVEV